MVVTLGSLPTVPALLITVLAMGECFAELCPDGWFGEECEYKCQCMEKCDVDDEDCSQCEHGFFGPECQYYDAVYWLGSPTNPPFLTNKSITTCNPSRFANVLKLTFKATLRFSWFRLQVNDESVLHKFQVKLNGVDNTCVKERRYNITQTTVDVFCDTTLLIKVLTIEGPVVPSICSIYVSAGRNVGLKQRAEQSSTANPTESRIANNSVDGNKNPDITKGFCSITQTESREAGWNLTLTRLAVVYRIQIYSSNFDSYMERGFTVSTHNTEGLLIEKQISPLPKDATITPYEFVMQSHLLVETVKVKGSIGVPLSMCEVLVFGDYVCPDLRHGLGCKQICQCRGHEICSVVSGKCSPGCPPGFYGYQCSMRCNASCIHDHCLQVTGRCYRCRAGYKGELCNEDCYAGTYGKSCENKCSVNCANECDAIDGFCECLNGYRQPGCTECPNGTYGNQCSQNCSVHCLDRKCDHVSGKCLACVGTRKGYFCEDCPKGMYGLECTKNCSMFCLLKKCDPNNGNCFKCLPGRIGAHCTECPVNYYGYMCNATCPENCESGLCHVETGLCGSCASNFIGPTCSRAVGYTGKLKYFSPLVLLCIIPCIVLLLRKRTDESESNHSTGAMTTHSSSQHGEAEDHLSESTL